MKFVCLNCEQYMAFQKVEAPEQGRLGITFGCAKCGARFSMVTNPGETQLVSSLGVSLGGRSEPLTPLEMTRGTLKTDEAAAPSATMSDYLETRARATASAPSPAPSTATAAATGAATTTTGGGCPFSAMVQDMGLGTAPAAQPGQSPAPSIDPEWSEPARAQIERLPSYVRHVLKRSVEDYARKHGYPTITPDVIDAQKQGRDGVAWSAEATERLGNIPDFVRPLARREIEKMARTSGATMITGETMDRAKGVFEKMGIH